MEEIKALFDLDYTTIIIGFFIIILGVDKIVFLLKKAKKGLRIKFGYEEDKETVEGRISKLEEHDRWQYNEISKISQGIEEIKNSLLQDSIESKRKNILDFCTTLSNGQKQNREAFNEIFRIYNEYEKILKENDMENGQAEESMKFISEKYQELLRTGNL